jgi:hypothetical protein
MIHSLSTPKLFRGKKKREQRKKKVVAHNHQFLLHIILYCPDIGSCVRFCKLNMFCAVGVVGHQFLLPLGFVS